MVERRKGWLVSLWRGVRGRVLHAGLRAQSVIKILVIGLGS